MSKVASAAKRLVSSIGRDNHPSLIAQRALIAIAAELRGDGADSSDRQLIEMCASAIGRKHVRDQRGWSAATLKVRLSEARRRVRRPDANASDGDKTWRDRLARVHQTPDSPVRWSAELLRCARFLEWLELQDTVTYWVETLPGLLRRMETDARSGVRADRGGPIIRWSRAPRDADLRDGEAEVAVRGALVTLAGVTAMIQLLTRVEVDDGGIDSAQVIASAKSALARVHLDGLNEFVQNPEKFISAKPTKQPTKQPRRKPTTAKATKPKRVKR